MSERSPVMTGGCQCGAVRYAVYAEPANSSICHCRMCQKATGSPFAAHVAIDAGDFEWSKGKPGTFATSALAARDFCTNCGTPLSFRLLEGTTIDLTIGSLDEPDRFSVSRQIGTESKLHWIDDIPDMPGKTTEENAGSEYVAKVKASRRREA